MITGSHNHPCRVHAPARGETRPIAAAGSDLTVLFHIRTRCKPAPHWLALLADVVPTAHARAHRFHRHTFPRSLHPISDLSSSQTTSWSTTSPQEEEFLPTAPLPSQAVCSCSGGLDREFKPKPPAVEVECSSTSEPT